MDGGSGAAGVAWVVGEGFWSRLTDEGEGGSAVKMAGTVGDGDALLLPLSRLLGRGKVGMGVAC